MSLDLWPCAGVYLLIDAQQVLKVRTTAIGFSSAPTAPETARRMLQWGGIGAEAAGGCVGATGEVKQREELNWMTVKYFKHSGNLWKASKNDQLI